MSEQIGQGQVALVQRIVLENRIMLLFDDAPVGRSKDRQSTDQGLL